MLSLPVLEAPATRAAPPAAPERSRAHGLVDSHGRRIRDLRLSITDRCNFRCVYCMDPDVRFLDSGSVMTPGEIERIASVCVRLGVQRIRITGGEPTVRADLAKIIKRVARAGPSDLSMTTNGALLDDRSLHAWRDAGLQRITISLDSVREDRFAQITRSRTRASDVIEGASRVERAGLGSVKINAVIVRGFNDDEIVDLVRTARLIGAEMRFIEYMPLDSAHAWSREKLVPASEIIERIERVFPLVQRGRERASATAMVYDYRDGAPGAVGLIAPVTRSFCGACSRLRITADAKVRPCLFSRDEFDLMPALRGGASDDAIARFLADATWAKQAGHGISSSGFVQPERPMSAIGG